MGFAGGGEGRKKVMMMGLVEGEAGVRVHVM